MGYYRLSLTAANLMPYECKTLAEQYILTPDWSAVSKEALAKNLLNKTRSSTANRQTHELVLRLSNLTSEQIFALPGLNPLSVARLCFLAVLKTYEIIKDFMLEVVCPKWAEMKDVLRPAEFFDFYESKILIHVELSSVSAKTLVRIRQMIFSILQKAGYLQSVRSGLLLPVHHDQAFVRVVKNENDIIKRCLGV